MKKRIKLFDPIIGTKEEIAINKVLKSGYWASGSGVGNVQKFEKKFNEYIGSNSCVTVNNGTSALQLAVSLFDVKNSEIIMPSLSFVSTAHSALYNNAKPVFVDVDPKTLCIDVEKIKKQHYKKTKVIIPVHFGGFPADLDKIRKICKENQINLVEDAAHAAGAKYKEKKIGTVSEAICFSFHPVKNLAMPNGGAITLNGKKNKVNSNLIKIKRWCGISNRHNSQYDITELGWNAYLNEFSAVIGLEQLKKLDKMNKIRKKIAKQYSTEINLEEKMPFSQDCSYHFFWIQVDNREKFMKKLFEKGIEIGTHYSPIHKMKFYKNKVKLPITESVASKIVTLPIHPNLSENDVDKIIQNVNKFSN